MKKRGGAGGGALELFFFFFFFPRKWSEEQKKTQKISPTPPQIEKYKVMIHPPRQRDEVNAVKPRLLPPPTPLQKKSKVG